MTPLTNRQDAFGHEIWDYLHGEEVGEVIERDDGYIDTSDGPKAYVAPYADWPAFERQAVRMARGRVLDVGCGGGRVALHLQEKGHEVVGIDNSPLAVRACRKRGVDDVRLMSVTQIGPRMGVFDTVIMFGNNFGLFGSFKRARLLLGKMAGMTSHKARIIAQTLDPYDTRQPEHLAYQRRNRRRDRMGGQVRIRVRHRSYVTPWFDYLLVSRDEMREIVEGTSWRVARMFDSPGPVYIALLEKEEQR